MRYLPLIALLLLACNDDDDVASSEVGVSEDSAAQPQDSATQDAALLDEGLQDGSVPQLDADPSCRHWLASLEGQIIDEEGQGIEGAKAQLCVRADPSGRLDCLRPGTTDADGHFYVEVLESKRCVQEAAMRIIKVGGEYANSYCHLELTEERQLSLEEGLQLFKVQSVEGLPPEADPGQLRTVSFPEGLELELSPEAIYTGSSSGYGELAGRLISPIPPLCHQQERPTLDGIYLFAPEADLETPASLRLPIEAPDGSRVQLSVLGGLECSLADQTHLPEATWAPFFEGEVNGGILEAQGLDGLPCLNWLGYRLLP